MPARITQQEMDRLLKGGAMPTSRPAVESTSYRPRRTGHLTPIDPLAGNRQRFTKPGEHDIDESMAREFIEKMFVQALDVQRAMYKRDLVFAAVIAVAFLLGYLAGSQ